MKKCPTETCNNQIKNSYQYCYECNKKDDPISDVETIYKKETIPKTVRNALWINNFGDSRTGKCQCCLREIVSIGNFHAGHIIAEVNGGSTSLDNLTVLCMLCNTSMGRYNVRDFIQKYNLHYGL